MAQPWIDLLSGDFYGDPAREAQAWMRAHSPVHFDETNGVWGVATYDGVVTVGRDPATFSNAGGTRPDTGPLPWMIDMDPPGHRTRRKLVSAGFTPAQVRGREARIGAICDDLIDAVCEKGECDFVHDLAAPLPLIVIGDLLGVAPEDRSELLRWSHDLLGSLGATDERIQAAAVAFGEYYQYAEHAIATRREQPTDDLISVFVHAQVDGDRLDEHEVIMESLLLLVGGNESTRHTISGGMELLFQHPDERRKLADDPSLLPSGVEEMLRSITPVKNMTRTLTRNAELCGQSLSEGDKVLLLYESANHDDAHFTDPERFDVERSPNDHLAFGFGNHFCLGASLARLEIATMFGRLAQRLPDLELATDDLQPRFLGAPVSMPVRFTPTVPVFAT